MVIDKRGNCQAIDSPASKLMNSDLSSFTVHQGEGRRQMELCVYNYLASDILAFLCYFSLCPRYASSCKQIHHLSSLSFSSSTKHSLSITSTMVSIGFRALRIWMTILTFTNLVVIVTHYAEEKYWRNSRNYHIYSYTGERPALKTDKLLPWQD